MMFYDLGVAPLLGIESPGDAPSLIAALERALDRSLSCGVARRGPRAYQARTAPAPRPGQCARTTTRRRSGRAVRSV
jgi:hypothetical protein